MSAVMRRSSSVAQGTREADLVDLLTDKHVKSKQHLAYDPDFFGDRKTVDQQVITRKKVSSIAVKPKPYQPDFFTNPHSGDEKGERAQSIRIVQPQPATGTSGHGLKTYASVASLSSAAAEPDAGSVSQRTHSKRIVARAPDHDMLLTGGDSQADRLQFGAKKVLYQPSSTDPMGLQQSAPSTAHKTGKAFPHPSGPAAKSSLAAMSPHFQRPPGLPELDFGPNLTHVEYVPPRPEGRAHTQPPPIVEHTAGKRTYVAPLTALFEAAPVNPPRGRRHSIAHGQESERWYPASQQATARPAAIDESSSVFGSRTSRPSDISTDESFQYSARRASMTASKDDFHLRPPAGRVTGATRRPSFQAEQGYLRPGLTPMNGSFTARF